MHVKTSYFLSFVFYIARDNCSVSMTHEAKARHCDGCLLFDYLYYLSCDSSCYQGVTVSYNVFFSFPLLWSRKNSLHALLSENLFPSLSFVIQTFEAT